MASEVECDWCKDTLKIRIIANNGSGWVFVKCPHCQTNSARTLISAIQNYVDAEFYEVKDETLCLPSVSRQR